MYNNDMCNFLELEEDQSSTNHGKGGDNGQGLGIRNSSIIMVIIVTSGSTCMQHAKGWCRDMACRSGMCYDTR